MLGVLESFYSTLAPPQEGFTQTTTNFVPLILALITLVILQLLLGKYLWNNFLTRLVPTVQPVKGIMDVLALSLLFRLLFC
jgi:hypothetical protein